MVSMRGRRTNCAREPRSSKSWPWPEPLTDPQGPVGRLIDSAAAIWECLVMIADFRVGSCSPALNLIGDPFRPPMFRPGRAGMLHYVWRPWKGGDEAGMACFEGRDHHRHHESAPGTGMRTSLRPVPAGTLPLALRRRPRALNSAPSFCVANKRYVHRLN